MQLLARVILIFTISQNLKADLLPDNNVCGVSTNSKLISGQITQIYEHPWTVRLHYEPEKKKFHCGGVLISKRYILTQAYCAEPFKNITPSTVRLDKNTPVEMMVEEVIKHEDYIPNKLDSPDNIALLRLSQDVEFNDFVKPVCLPKTSEEKYVDYDGQNLETAGWGTHNEFDDFRIKLESIGINKSECIRKLPHSVVGDDVVCAINLGTICWVGNIGNPLMVNRNNSWMLIGTESYGPHCFYDKENPTPTVYTNVVYYLDWIMKHIKA